MSYIELLVPVLLGGISYVVVHFWMVPLHRYIDIKHAVTSDLIFYANAIRAEGMSDRIKHRKAEREEKNRKNAAEFVAAYYRLPFWYKWILARRFEDPLLTSRNLIGLSNEPDWKGAQHHIGHIKKALGIENLDV